MTIALLTGKIVFTIITAIMVSTIQTVTEQGIEVMATFLIIVEIVQGII